MGVGRGVCLWEGKGDTHEWIMNRENLRCVWPHQTLSMINYNLTQNSLGTASFLKLEANVVDNRPTSCQLHGFDSIRSELTQVLELNLKL